MVRDNLVDNFFSGTYLDTVSGGLLGDVFLHLLPHAFLGEHVEQDVSVKVDEQKNVLIGLGIFGGFFFFFLMDKLMRVFNGGGGHDHNHHHYAHDVKKHEDDNDVSATAVKEQPEGLRQRVVKNKEEDIKEEEEKDHQDQAHNNDRSIKLSAYLNLFADFTHNMTDGLAMAASFYASPSVGATTAVAVFFHEIPHEVGDYAILVQSGFSKQRAMMAQFTTAVGAFLGTIIGIIIEQLARSGETLKEHHVDVPGILGTDLHASDLVIPFTAGGFLYIATVGVVPELLQVTGKLKKDWNQASAEFIAMIVGVSLMAVIAWNEGAA